MSETPETPSTATPAAATTTQQKPYWLYRLAAWVAIVAGILFIVATIFFSGAALTHHRGCHGHHGHHGHHHSMVQPGHHHRQHPGPGAGVPGPGQAPTSTAPSLAPPTP
ncbi:hypothetical protein E2F47_26330 [Mycobacterium eburneum]|nr:hypothetical protein E2F47_26330 [Mycobacterium eburneum]